MKQAIIFASFGVADAKARAECIDKTASLLADSLPEFTVCQAFTSVFIKKKLAAAGIIRDSLPEALAKLQAAGFQLVIIQPSHLTRGEEFEQKIVAAAKAYKKSFQQLLLSQPILAAADAYAEVIAAVLPGLELKKGEQLVWLGHGSPHQHNPVYEGLQAYADANNLPINVGVLEPNDTPNFAMVLKRLKKASAKEVLLAPLLLAGGRHVAKDLAGSGNDSWQSRLEQAGFKVTVDKRGLGEYADFRKLYLARLKQCLKEPESYKEY